MVFTEGISSLAIREGLEVGVFENTVLRRYA
jgi:hypothetical protein